MSGRSGNLGAKLLGGFFVFFLAILVGLFATTASPILIGLLVGCFFGVILLSKPEYSIWIVVVGGLLVGGLVVQFLPKANKIVWLFSMVGFLLLAGSVIQVMLKPDSLKGLHWFAILALLFPVYSMIVTLANLPPVAELFAGAKRYFQFWGLFAALVILPVSEGMFRKVLKFFILLSLVQFVFAVYQLLFVVPSRVGMGGGVVAIDAVSGTFESSQTGGGSSSILVMYVLVAFAFFLRAWRDKVLTGKRMLLVAPLVLAPLFMGETKIVVVILPLVLIVALQGELRRNPFTGFLILLLGAVLTVALGYIYLKMAATSGSQGWERTLDKIVATNFGNAGYHLGGSGLNRTTVLSFWWNAQSWSDPVAALFGHGIGSSYSGEGSLVPGHVAMRYPSLAIAFTGLAALLWDVGLVGLILFLLMMFGAWRATRKAMLAEAPGWRRAVLVAVEAGLLMNCLLLFYSGSMFALPSHEVILMLLLGAAAVLSRKAVR